MNRIAKTSHDKTIFAMVLVPLAALVVLFVSAGAQWQLESARVRPLLLQSLPADVVDAPSPIAFDYAQSTDPEKTATLRELLYAVGELNRKFDPLRSTIEEIDYLSSTERAEELSRLVKDYLDQAQPLLKLVLNSELDAESVWLPQELGNPNYWSQDQNRLFGVGEMLLINFYDAVRSGDGERALASYRASHRLMHTWDNRNSLDPLIATTVASGLWDREQLEQLDRLIVTSSDVQAMWRDQVRSQMVRQTPALLTGSVPRDYWSDPIKVTVAPSRRVEWIERFQQYAEIANVGTRGADEQVMKSGVKQYETGLEHIDTSLQFPYYTNRYTDDSMSGYTRSYVKLTNERRFNRTAIAIAKFKLDFGDYPNSLSDLSQVGLPIGATSDPLGRDFSHKKNESGFVLANASIWFPSQPGSLRSTVSPEMILGTYLNEYREVTFE